MLGGFAVEEPLEQVQRSAYEAEAVEDHRLDGYAGAHRLLGVNPELVIDHVHQADIIDDAGDNTEVIEAE